MDVLPANPVPPDLEMHSQTETEDTDGGDMHASSSSSDLNSSSVDSSSSSSASAGKADEGSGVKIKTEPLHTLEKSVDLTDVTELSNLEDFSAAGRKDSDLTKLEDVEAEMPKFDFTGDWYNQKCFHRYWTNYHHAMAWCRKHFRTYQELQRKYNSEVYQWSQRESGSYFSAWQHPYMNAQKSCSQDISSGAVHKTKSPKSNIHHRRRRAKAASAQRRGTSESGTQTSEEFEMELTPEMIEFFAKSKKHKEQRDELKRAQNNTEEERKRINVEEVKVSNEKVPSVEPPKRQPGSKRTEEMKLLYGKGAAMIHGMETAIQMTFDRNTDIKQPKMWPNMPLKIVFG